MIGFVGRSIRVVALGENDDVVPSSEWVFEYRYRSQEHIRIVTGSLMFHVQERYKRVSREYEREY